MTPHHAETAFACYAAHAAARGEQLVWDGATYRCGAFSAQSWEAMKQYITFGEEAGMEPTTHKAPFPYFGGKSKVAPLIWQRFGNVQNYVEPFFGSGAVLLGCPQPGHTETVNDVNGLLCNFWRALQHDPEQTAFYADWPVNETDLHARHRWLVARKPDVKALLDSNPDAFDAKAAGWWVWGASAWIGSGWCAGPMPNKMPSIGAMKDKNGSGGDGSKGVHIKRPHLMSRKGTHSARDTGAVREQLPHLNGDSGTAGAGIHATAFDRKTGGIYAYFDQLATRLRRVRVCCGDFERILGPSVTWRHGLTAVFLDPPYSQDERADVYAHESDAAIRARAWALENGTNPLLRIAYCGYEIEGTELTAAGWRSVPWKTNGGYGSQGTGRGRANASREVIWFNQSCIDPAADWTTARKVQDVSLEDLPLWSV